MEHFSYIHYGCGWSAPEAWRNFDASPTLRFERSPLLGKLYTKNKDRFPTNVEYGDIVQGLPITNQSCEAVYCSHVLEHLSLEDCRAALKNTYNMLKPGGCFRSVQPDLEVYIKEYIDDSSNLASLNFMHRTFLGRAKRNRGIKGFLLDWLGNSHHLWLWDFKSFAKELEEVGFRNIRRAQFGDSAISEFTFVENRERWDNCLGVECFK